MESTVRKELASYRERVMAEEALKEDEFNRMLEDAAQNMLPPPADDLEDAGITPEEYQALLAKVSKSKKPSDEE